jgi:hypothetical protein
MGEYTIRETRSPPEVWRRAIEELRGGAGPLARLSVRFVSQHVY